MFYTVRNDGPEDLDSVIMRRPRTEDQVVYPIAPVGQDYGPDEIELGPLALTQEKRFVMCLGAASTLPEFRVRIDRRARRDKWTLTETLGTPRRGLGIY